MNEEANNTNGEEEVLGWSLTPGKVAAASRNTTIGSMQGRNERKRILERKLATSDLRKERRINLTKDLEGKETENMQLKRNNIRVDGLGASGEQLNSPKQVRSGSGPSRKLPRRPPRVWRDCGKWRFDGEIEHDSPLLVQNLLTELGKRIECLTRTKKNGGERKLKREGDDLNLKPSKMSRLMCAQRLKIRNGADVTGVIHLVNDMEPGYTGTIEVHNTFMRNWISRKLDAERKMNLKWKIQSPHYDLPSEDFLPMGGELDYPRSSSAEDESPTDKSLRRIKRRKVPKVFVDDEDDDLKQPFEYGSEPDSTSSSSDEMIEVGEGVIPGGVSSDDDDDQCCIPWK